MATNATTPSPDASAVGPLCSNCGKLHVTSRFKNGKFKKTCDSCLNIARNSKRKAVSPVKSPQQRRRTPGNEDPRISPSRQQRQLLRRNQTSQATSSQAAERRHVAAISRANRVRRRA